MGSTFSFLYKRHSCRLATPEGLAYPLIIRELSRIYPAAGAGTHSSLSLPYRSKTRKKNIEIHTLFKVILIVLIWCGCSDGVVDISSLAKLAKQGKQVASAAGEESVWKSEGVKFPPSLTHLALHCSGTVRKSMVTVYYDTV